MASDDHRLRVVVWGRVVLGFWCMVGRVGGSRKCSAVGWVGSNNTSFPNLV